MDGYRGIADSFLRAPAPTVSVPINCAYNHHHDVYLTGKHSEMQKVPYDPNDLTIPMMARSDPNFLTVPVETSKSPLDLPTSLHNARMQASTPLACRPSEPVGFFAAL